MGGSMVVHVVVLPDVIRQAHQLADAVTAGVIEGLTTALRRRNPVRTTVTAPATVA